MGDRVDGDHHGSMSRGPSADDSSGDLAHLLEPTLINACEGRLSRVDWFRSAWQAGGGSTGFASYTQPDGTRHSVVVKLPVGPSEHRWTTALGLVHPDSAHENNHHAGSNHHPRRPRCTPRVWASGTELGGYDLAWLVMERLDGLPLKANMCEPTVRDLLSAAVEWYGASSMLKDPADASPPAPKDWAALLAKGRDIIHRHGILEEQRWNLAIKSVQRALDTLLTRWQHRPMNSWCHGDLHFGNAMRRIGDEPGHGCVLIDLALVHPGHWVEDAVYLERLYWAKPELLHGIKPVSEMARLHREQGTLGTEDYVMLANVRRVLMAASVPAFLLHEGHPKYVHAALEIIEKLLPMVSR